MRNWMINQSSESDHWDRSVDLTVVIGGQGTSYPCPSIFAVDQHIRRLYRHSEVAAPWHPELVEALRADIDLLLDRRLWLEMDPGVGDAA
jgi:hypothetical protein